MYCKNAYLGTYYGKEQKNVFEIVDKNLDQETLQRIIANIPSNIFFKDTESRYRLMTHIWEQVEGESLIGKTDYEIRKDTENIDIAVESDRKILKTGKGTDYVIKSDIDGKTSYLQLIKEPIYDDNDEALGVVALINDVTEQTLLEKKLIEVSDELKSQNDALESSNGELLTTLKKVEQMEEARNLFTASMNHELRSPLNGIIGSLQILLSDRNLSDSQMEYIKNAYDASKHLLDIVNDLLDHAKIETNEFRINYDNFEADDIISGIVNTSKTLADEKGLEFTVEKNNVEGKVFVGDDTRIKQIMYNLVSNAIKYTDKGKVILSVSYENGNLIIKCSDTGQGISKKAQEVLFDPFVRIEEKKNKDIQGTGLGLSVVKLIVEKMKGTVELESEVGVGSTFTVTIPMEMSNEKVTHEKKTDEADTSGTVDFSNISILCVDDTTTNVLVFEGLLKDTNIKIDKAYSGQAAVEMAEKKKYDVIFMDHLMPKMDGEEALRIIRSQCEINKDTPVVVFTGDASIEAESGYRQMGFDGFLLKPVFKNRLIELIRNFTI